MSRPAPRSAALDGLRGIAIALVVAVHASAFLVPRSFPAVYPGGYLGVMIFFALSGYLITGLLLGDVAAVGRIRIRRFYARRAWRLLPALLVVVAAHAAYALARGLDLHREASWAVATATYTANWYYLAIHGLTNRGLDQVWSLAVEEQFYLVWPLALFAAWRLGGRRAAVGLTVVLLAASVVDAAWQWQLTPNWSRVYFRSDVEAGPLLTGCLFALERPRLPAWLGTPAALTSLATILVLSGLVPRNDYWLYGRGGLTVVAMAAAVVIAQSQDPWVADLLSVRPLTWLGRTSYSLYLWHFPVFVAVYDLHLPPAAALGVGLPTAFGAAAGSYYLVERPLLRWRDRRYGAPAAAGEVPDRALPAAEAAAASRG